VSTAAPGPSWSDIAGWYDGLLSAGSGPHETAVQCLLRLVPPTGETGWGVDQIAPAWAELMRRGVIAPSATDVGDTLALFEARVVARDSLQVSPAAAACCRADVPQTWGSGR